MHQTRCAFCAVFGLLERFQWPATFVQSVRSGSVGTQSLLRLTLVYASPLPAYSEPLAQLFALSELPSHGQVLWDATAQWKQPVSCSRCEPALRFDWPRRFRLGSVSEEAELLRSDSYTDGVTTQVPGCHATGKGEPLKTAARASSMQRPCLRIVER